MTRDKAKCLNLGYDRIKYINASDHSRIYEMNIDGSGRKKLSDASAAFLVADSETAYYIDDASGKLYGLIQGSGKKVRLSDEAVRAFNVVNDIIVYETKKDNNVISINNTGGNRETLLEGCDADWLGLDYNYVYYPDGKKIKACRLDGTGMVFELGKPTNN